MSKENSLVKYVLVELHVENENLRELATRMPEVVSLIVKLFGWELVYAAYPISGQINRLVHIWKIGNESSVLNLMIQGSMDFAEHPENELIGHFNRAYQAIQHLIGKTKHRFMTSMPYDPAFVGEQTQTVIVDGAEQKTIFSHRTLRAREELVVKDGTRLSKELDTFLSRGVTSGWVDDSPFFNLAALKPISIFQERKELPSTDAVDVRIPHHPKGRLPSAGPAIVVAMPWGRAYRLDTTALRKVARPIPQEAASATDEILRPLIEGRVPLANIPTPRDLPIGQGCLCFVINLNSFVG